MAKILTWNTLGDNNGQHRWITTWASRTFNFTSLDLAVFVESGAGNHFPGSQVVQECGGASLVLPPAGGTTFEAACATLLGTNILRPLAGVGRLACYELYSPARHAIPAASVVDFATSKRIVAWVLRPLELYINRHQLGAAAGPPSGGPAGGRVRPTRTAAQTSPFAGSRPPWLKQTWVDLSTDRKNRIRAQVQQRVNLLGQRRPMYISLNGADIYFWHAPLGGQTLDGLGLSKSAVGQGSGGDLAVACNELLAIYLKAKEWDAGAGEWQTRAFPANTYVVGDLNLTAKGVRRIYGAPSAAASSDGWCHIVWAAGVGATSYTDTLATLSHPRLSDHDPVAIY